MASEIPEGAVATVNAELKVGDRLLSAKFSVPAGPTRLVDVLPIVQRVADAIVDAGVADAESQGRCVTCAKGCGACCRQLVPISEVEARNIRDLVEAMPEPRRSQVRARFAEAKHKLDAVGVWRHLVEREGWSEETFVEMGTHYFHQGVPCPFLEEESCSIHRDRPITCREYLVTSPPANCGCPTKDNIEKVDMPAQVWTALARFDQTDPAAKYIRWVPLVMAPEWADAHPEEAPPRPGPELLRELFERLAGNKAPQSPSSAVDPATLPPAAQEAR